MPGKRGNPNPKVLVEQYMMRCRKGLKAQVQNAAKQDGFPSSAELTRKLWNYYLRNRDETLELLKHKRKRILEGRR